MVATRSNRTCLEDEAAPCLDQGLRPDLCHDVPRHGKDKRSYEPLRLVGRGGRVGFLENLIGDIMGLGGPAQIGELTLGSTVGVVS